jgi:hypothetical protein
MAMLRISERMTAGVDGEGRPHEPLASGPVSTRPRTSVCPHQFQLRWFTQRDAEKLAAGAVPGDET